MDKVNKLYEVIIGAYSTEVVPEVPATDTTPAVSATTKTNYSDCVGTKRVVATDVAEAIAKVQLTEGQHVEAVNRLSVVDTV